jgi:hypothetical protein
MPPSGRTTGSRRTKLCQHIPLTPNSGNYRPEDCEFQNGPVEISGKFSLRTFRGSGEAKSRGKFVANDCKLVLHCPTEASYGVIGVATAGSNRSR